MRRLLERHVIRRVPDEQRRQGKCSDRDARRRHHKDVSRRERRGGQAACRGGDRHAAIAGSLVQPERQPPLPRPDEVDLHDHRHRPCEALVDPEQRVRGHDPGPARRHADQ